MEDIRGLDDDIEQITIISDDGRRFQVDKQTARKSALIEALLQSDRTVTECTIAPPKAPKCGEALGIVLEYLESDMSSEPTEIKEPLRSIDLSTLLPEAEFKFILRIRKNATKDEEPARLFVIDVLNTAFYLGVSHLVRMCCAIIAADCTGHDEAWICEKYECSGKYTEEEARQVREASHWK